MKCVAYVSRTNTSVRDVRMPIGLSDIIRTSSRYNPKSQITGVILYREGQYFQVIEGPYLEVDKLMAKITADTRHKDLWVFLDMRVTQRSFPSWGASVFDFVDQGPSFNTFIHKYRQTLDSFDDSQKQRIAPFVNVKEALKGAEKYYEGMNIRLLAWPDLNRVSQPQLIMELCVKLTKKPYSFNELADSGQFGTHHQVTEIIREFDKIGILQVTEPSPELVNQSAITEKKPNKFYGAIKKFLGMR